MHGLLSDAYEDVADDLALVLGRGRVAQQRRVSRAASGFAHHCAALSELHGRFYLLNRGSSTGFYTFFEYVSNIDWPVGLVVRDPDC